MGRPGLSPLAEQQDIRDALPTAVQRERTVREALGRAPKRSRLEGEIARAMRRLLPHEIEELRRAVTRPQFAVAMKIREAAREALRGSGRARAVTVVRCLFELLGAILVAVRRVQPLCRGIAFGIPST